MARVHVTITDDGGTVLRRYTIEEDGVDEASLAEEAFADDCMAFEKVEDVG